MNKQKKPPEGGSSNSILIIGDQAAICAGFEANPSEAQDHHCPC
jgi:hypothetical protein